MANTLLPPRSSLVPYFPGHEINRIPPSSTPLPRSAVPFSRSIRSSFRTSETNASIYGPCQFLEEHILSLPSGLSDPSISSGSSGSSEPQAASAPSGSSGPSGSFGSSNPSDPQNLPETYSFPVRFFRITNKVHPGILPSKLNNLQSAI